MKPAFYNPFISYEENYTKGPPVSAGIAKIPKRKKGKTFTFLGHDVGVPFGIPPGPLLNSKFMKSAFEWGYDVSTYKTVRAEEFPCHPFPNVLFVKTPKELHPDKTPRLVASSKTKDDKEKFSITNSFGVPSMTPNVWQKDVKKSLGYVNDRQLLILSFMGTVRPNQTQSEFITDFGKAAALAHAAGAKVLEANLSCPNIGNEGLVCYNLDATEKVAAEIRKKIGNTPLILKVGYYKNDKDLTRLAEIAEKYAQGIAAINTLQIEIVDAKGNQALPGNNRLRSGVCGASIRWAGLEMTERLSALRKKKKYHFSIIGIGGVMTAKDYLAYRKAGADVVQAATGPMWNPSLAMEIWKAENT